jgi:carboxymethylenebutenolidase
MTRVTQAMIDLYDEFTHRTADRRALMTGLARLAGGAAAASALLPLIEARAEAAPLVAADDKRIRTETAEWAGAGDHRMKGYLVTPAKSTSKAPRVMVIHENRGLTEHIRDIARRLGTEGFVALAPDFLSPLGGTPDGDDDKARTMIGQLDRAATISDGVATLEWLAKAKAGKGVPGAVGFCWGGGMVNAVAIAAGDRLRAGVAYYGPTPADLTQVTKIKARMLLHYAGLDERINASAPAYEEALKAAGVTFEAYVYPGVNHAFNNDTSAARYDKAAADLAWGRTLAWLKG